MFIVSITKEISIIRLAIGTRKYAGMEYREVHIQRKDKQRNSVSLTSHENSNSTFYSICPHCNRRVWNVPSDGKKTTVCMCACNEYTLVKFNWIKIIDKLDYFTQMERRLMADTDTCAQGIANIAHEHKRFKTWWVEDSSCMWVCAPQFWLY